MILVTIALSSLFRSLSKPEGVTVCHFLHKPPLRQARNVDWLIANSRGDRLILLHDDDLLCDNGLDKLVEAWEAESGIVCAYGKQYVLSPAGEVLFAETEDFNRQYGRVKDNCWRAGVATFCGAIATASE